MLYVFTNSGNIKAGADLVEGQVVKVTTGGVVIPTSATDTEAHGVVVAGAKSGKQAHIASLPGGFVRALAAGTIAAGSDLFLAAGGKVASTGTTKIGKALSDATADDFVDVLGI